MTAGQANLFDRHQPFRTRQHAPAGCQPASHILQNPPIHHRFEKARAARLMLLRHLPVKKPAWHSPPGTHQKQAERLFLVPARHFSAIRFSPKNT
jgi:hypothetical protein